MRQGEMYINKVSGKHQFHIRRLVYNNLMLISNYLRNIDGYSYITDGALVVEGTDSQLMDMINFIDEKFEENTYEYTTDHDQWLGTPDDIREILKKGVRDEKINNLLE